MQNYAKLIVSGLIVATISSITTYAWNHQTLDEMVEQTNREAIISCLTKARTETTSQKILQATETCKSHLFTTVSAPLVSTGYLSTGEIDYVSPLEQDCIQNHTRTTHSNDPVMIQEIRDCYTKFHTST